MCAYPFLCCLYFILYFDEAYLDVMFVSGEQSYLMVYVCYFLLPFSDSIDMFRMKFTSVRFTTIDGPKTEW